MRLRLLILAVAIAVPVFLAAPQARAPKKLSSFDAQAKALLSQMTLEEKIGQMTQPEQDRVKDLAEIEKLAFGSILSGGGSDPKEGNSLQAWTDLYDRLQKHALASRLKIPILYGVDAVHGHNNVLGAVIFPHNIGLGCTRNAALVEKVERITAEEVRATGIQWAFAPCVTVPQDTRWGRSYEGFSEDPQVVKELSEAAVRGFQGSDLANPLAVLSCAKHYVGDGGTAFGSVTGRRGPGLDQGDMRVDEETLRRIHLQGYISTVKAGVGTIMPSYNSWNGVKVSGDKHLLTEVLKGELGFEGFLISDYNAVDQIDRDYKKAIGISINAGMDMVMVPDHYKLFMENLKQLVNEGTVPASRIDDAVLRILRVKFAMGLMDSSRSQLADRSLQKTFGSAEHRAVARQAVRESLVLLKNEKKTLPIARTAAHIHVAGKSADDLGNQCGGWTIDWQGKSGNVTTGGTTLLAAIRKAAKGKVTFSADGKGAEGATLGVVAIGERPYAEGAGDRADLSLAPEDIAAIANIKSAGIPVVVVLFSGRPMILGDTLDKADAFLAAWLPGSEGDGIADVLFGDSKPTGKLSFAWPRSMDGYPRPKNGNPLFAFGYGLTY